MCVVVKSENSDSFDDKILDLLEVVAVALAVIALLLHLLVTRYVRDSGNSWCDSGNSWCDSGNSWCDSGNI
jgi:hypothetical protein